MLRTSLIALCAFVLMCTSCRQHGRRHVTTAFYHWKTEVNITPEDSAMLSGTGCKKLYVNFFEVVQNNDTSVFKYPAVPGSQTGNLHGLPHDMEIVPVIYVTNESMKKMDSSTVPLIAEKIARKLARTLKANKFDSIKELQIDCDWTNSTRDKYFYLLSQIKMQTRVPILSATIRLYQHKYYKKAGVPPVDKGLLMFYHMNPLRDIDSKELILDVEEGKKYLTGVHYPLHLDYALPLFSEMLVGNYQGVDIYSPKTFARLMQEDKLEKKDSIRNTYKVKFGEPLSDRELDPWQTIRLETTNKEALKSAATLLSSCANSDTFNVIFFHLDRDANSTFTPHEVKDIIDRFN